MAAPAHVAVGADTVRITLRGVWPLLALCRTVEVPRSGVRGAEVVDDARSLLRGKRLGTYVPGGPIAGRFFAGADTDFWAVRGGDRALVLTMSAGPFSRIVVETDDAAHCVRDLGGAPASGATAVQRPARGGSQRVRSVGLASIVAGVTALIGLAALAADALPSPMATHWGIGGGPNGQMSIVSLTIIVVVMYAAVAAPAVVSLRHGFVHPHIVAFAAAGWAFSFLVLLSSVVANWHRESWHEARLPPWAVPLTVFVPLTLGHAVFRLMQRRVRLGR